MNKTAFAGIGLLLLAGCDDAFLATIPGTEQYIQLEEERRAWEKAVATVNCRLVSEREYLPVELQAGLTRERVTAILSEKIATGEAQALEEGGYRYVGGPCAPAAPAPAPAPAA